MDIHVGCFDDLKQEENSSSIFGDPIAQGMKRHELPILEGKRQKQSLKCAK